jgi:ADP-heptose:LPS heptosyltransferase
VIPLNIRYRFFRFPVWNYSEVETVCGKAPWDLAIYLRTFPNFFRSFLRIPAKAHVHARHPQLHSASPFQYPVSVATAHSTHISRQLLQIIEPLLGRPVAPTDFEFPPIAFSESDQAKVDPQIPRQPFLVCHPFCRYETRRYPIEWWAELWSRIHQELGYEILVIGGKEDPPIPFQKGVTSVQGQFHIAETAYLLTRSIGFLGGDSGPGHLASALGVPTFTIFGGMSYPAEWQPLRATTVLKAEAPCAPCERRYCPGYGLICMKSLPPDRVWKTLRIFLSEKLSLE